ncbi:fibronectin type III domain-containing protein [Helicobacter acinonychis]|uniref:fibronectin type III domain-containing protein n=1 Tax=Helicobacter acinonychis TaxID=212 RepID=UPI00155904F8|nr:fibronectin type III domain-containing protein [Helicobacter acinonychis]
MKKKYFMLLIQSSVVLAIFIGCSSTRNHTFSALNNKENIDTKLPVVHSIKTINDVSSVGFEWPKIDDTYDIDGFILYRLKKDSQLKRIATLKNPYATHYYDEGLETESSYTYQIATYKGDKVSNLSEPILVKTSFINPVESVFASLEYPRSVKIFWSPHPNPSVSRYIIQRQNKDGKFLNVGTVRNRLFVEFFDRDLEYGKKYRYRIIAENFMGDKSRPSMVVEGKTKDLPKEITNVRVSQNLTRQIELSWDKSPQVDVVAYRIYASNNRNDKYKLIAQTTNTSYVDKIEKDNLTRYYKVVALDKTHLEGALPKEPAIGETADRPEAPVIVKGIIQDASAFIQWENNLSPRIVAYAVYRFEDNSKTPLRFGNVTQNQFVDKDMKVGVPYRYQVVSVDKDGLESHPSKEVRLFLER